MAIPKQPEAIVGWAGAPLRARGNSGHGVTAKSEEPAQAGHAIHEPNRCGHVGWRARFTTSCRPAVACARLNRSARDIRAERLARSGSCAAAAR